MTEPKDTPIDQLPLNESVRLLAHNVDGLVALEKPPGVLSHPNTAEDNQRSLLNADYDLEQECYSWRNASGEVQQAWLINRLDAPTSGVILLGLNSSISQAIKSKFATHHVIKVYYALVRGKPSLPVGAWTDRLKKEVPRGKGSGTKQKIVFAKARYQMVKSPTGGFPLSLVKLMPVTGRTHQLRVQCRKHGLPVVGDRNYGNFSFNKEVVLRTGKKRMMLHSAETTVRYSYKGKARKFAAASELPADFQAVLDYRPGLNRGLPENARDSSRSAVAGRRFKV